MAMNNRVSELAESKQVIDTKIRKEILRRIAAAEKEHDLSLIHI